MIGGECPRCQRLLLPSGHNVSRTPQVHPWPADNATKKRFSTWREIENLDTRARYLDQICAGDRALRERVEALLRVHEQEREFLKSVEAGPAVTADASPLTERPGTVVDVTLLKEPFS